MLIITERAGKSNAPAVLLQIVHAFFGRENAADRQHITCHGKVHLQPGKGKAVYPVAILLISRPGVLCQYRPQGSPVRRGNLFFPTRRQYHREDMC